MKFGQNLSLFKNHHKSHYLFKMYEDVKFGWQMFGLNKELELAQEGTINMDTPSSIFFFY